MTTSYHVACNGEEIGIFEHDDILAKLASGELSPDCYIWQEGMENWIPITSMVPPTAPIAPGSWGIIEAVKTVYWYRYADFSGRASRSEYWYSVLGVFLLMVAVSLILSVLTPVAAFCAGNSWVAAIPLAIVMLALFAALLYAFVPSISVMVRRLHDIGMSGWFYLLGFVPYVGGIFLFVVALLPSKGANQWGAGPEGPGPREQK